MSKALHQLPKKVIIVVMNDWEAVYFDGDLVHCHDSLSASRAFGLLGIECEYEEYFVKAAPNGKMPDKLEDYLAAVRSVKASEIEGRVKQHEREIKALTAQITRLRSGKDD